MFLVNDQRDAQFFSMYLLIFLTLYMFRAHRAHHQERQTVSIQPLVAVGGRVVFKSEVHFRPAHDTATDTERQTVSIQPLVAVGGSVVCRSKFTSDLDTTRPSTQSDSYQRLYWHNFSVLKMSTMCSKHISLFSWRYNPLWL